VTAAEAPSADWLRQPWAGAALRCILDPLAGTTPPPPQGWPASVPMAAVLADTALRARLARRLLPEEATRPLLAACTASPRARLALVPAEQAVEAMARAAAWIDAPHIAGLLRRAEVEAVRAALGEAAHGFALRGAALLPRPDAALAAAVSALPVADPLRGAALFGLAAGPLPPALLSRLALRAPAPLWAEVARRAADGTVPLPLREAAFAALRRLLREAAPTWLTWLN
jgi:hypothetical protein